MILLDDRVGSRELYDYEPGAFLVETGGPGQGPNDEKVADDKSTTTHDVEREGKDLVLMEAGPGTILGELAVLCGIPRSASVRAKENSAVLEWNDEAFRTLLLRDHSLSQRIFGQALRTLIEKERSLIDSLVKAQATGGR